MSDDQTVAAEPIEKTIHDTVAEISESVSSMSESLGEIADGASRDARRNALQIHTDAYDRLIELSKQTGYSRTSIAEFLITHGEIEAQVAIIKRSKLVVRRPGRARKSFHPR